MHDAEPLLERERELDTLATTLSRAKDGSGSVAIIESAPGLGKSRLLAATRVLAQADGLATLGARANELESDFAFGLVLQLFERRLRRASAAERQRLLDGAAGLTVPLWGGAESQIEAGRDFSLLHGLHWLAANIADVRPLALLVDDAHWADPLSLRFLLYLANRIEDLPIALVLARRERAAGGAEALLRELAAHPAATGLRLMPLSRDGVAVLLQQLGLVAGPPGEHFVDAAFDVTRGNPFLVRELALALAAECVPPDESGAARVREIGPEPVSEATALALGRLPHAATSVARSLAVLGDDAELPVLAELAGLREGDAAAAVAALIGEGVLERGPRPCFVHPIVRAALYEELSSHERSAAHRRAAQLLRDRGGRLARVAAHLLRAEPRGESWAVEALREAAERANERGARGSAAAYLERAIEEEAGDRRELYLELARAQTAAADPAASASYEEAIALAREPRERASVLRELGRALYLHSRFDEALNAFDRGLETLGSDDDGLAMHLAAGKSAAMLWSPGAGGDPFAEIGTLLARARAGASVADRAVLANLAGAEMLRGQDRERSLELASLAWGNGAILDQGPTLSEPSILAITAALTVSEEWDAAVEVCEAMLDEARRRGLVLTFATFSYVRGYAQLMLGNVSDAIADAEQALSARTYGWRLFSSAALWVHTVGRIERGELDAAAAALEVGADDEAQMRATPAYSCLPLARAEHALARGDAAAAVVFAGEARELLENQLGLRNSGWFDWLGVLVRALARAGRRQEAIEAADDNLERARRWGAPRALAEALRVRGLAEGAAGAVSWLEEAVATGEPGPARLTYARASVDLGAALRVAGKRTRAADMLRRGLDAASRCGALALADRAREELVIAGGRPRRERTWGVEGLTPSERRVAEMAASGMTNREIAEALFVTVKAVEYHLRNVYGKLEIERRSELPSALRPEGVPA